MKKMLSILLACALAVSMMSACGSKETPKDQGNQTVTQGAKEEEKKQPEAEATPEVQEPEENAEIVNGRFVETRKITVEIYERGNDGGSKPEDNFFTDFIKEGMLRDHNVEVTYVPVPRWTEKDQINNLLAAGDAPDVCLTYDYPTIQTYANMGGVMDLSTYVEDYKDMLPNLWGWLQESNMYWDRDPEKGTIWALEARLANSTRINTFVREDWLKKLNLASPTTLEEFEKMLVAFKDNASLLLGADADKMVPFGISFDIGWRADHLLASFVPSSITEQEQYINGFDDRRFLYPGIKEGVKLLNKWYNDGLIWKDFAIYGSGDPTEDNMMKAGYVGAFMHNWDYPYRDGDNSINNNLKRLVGEDAGYVAVMPFKNDAGVYAKFLPAPVDRKIFFPTTNEEPLASLLYLDWITAFENRKFLQIGEEGVNHTTLADGSIQAMAATGEKIMNSPLNIDYTMTINGLNLETQELTAKSLSLSYVGVDAKYIELAYDYSIRDGIYGKQHSYGEITSESGMGPALSEKRDVILTQSVTAPADKFDSVFDSGMADYLSSGGQAIIDERKAAWESHN
ncbi:putative aldouronate transport system substrate-binding protein [Anaerotaenia torta]|uniref:extracellular solute-binding protein n=1 Tax=Anaerotaenia torta TaxID=433293 RepID=UPI003D1CD20A